MKVVVVIQVAQKAGSSISWRTLGLLFLIAEYRLKTTHTHTHTTRIFISAEGAPCERFCILVLLSGKGLNVTAHVVNHLTLYKLPCHTHTYKAYIHIICSKLCVMTLNSGVDNRASNLTNLTK